MPVSLRSLGIDRLPVDEQLALVREIWDHIIVSGRVRRSAKRNSRNCAGTSPRTTPTPTT